MGKKTKIEPPEPLRSDEGRFDSPYTDDDLYALVAAVIAANGLPPDEEVSQRTWDAGRAVSEEFRDAPSARRIAARLKRSWKHIVAIAQQRPGMPTYAGAVTATTRQVENALLDERHLMLGLTKAAERIDARSFGRNEYDGERAEILREASREKTLGYWERMLPTSAQIERIAGDWDVALVMAGLDPRPGVTLTPAGRRRAERIRDQLSKSKAPSRRVRESGLSTTRRGNVRRGSAGARAPANEGSPPQGPESERRAAPVAPPDEPLTVGSARSRGAANGGLPLERALAEFARSQGGWPSSANTLRVWVSHHNIGVVGIKGTFPDALTAAAEILLADGIEPPMPTTTRTIRTLDMDAPVAAGLPRKRPTRYSCDDVVEAVARCMRETGKTTDLRQRDYLNWVRAHKRAGDTRLPVLTALQAHGGFAAVRNQALETLAAEVTRPR